MDLNTFPKVDSTQITCGQIPEMKEWIKKAANAGFRENWHNNNFCKLVSNLFYKGGDFPKKKKGIDEEIYLNGFRYFRCWLGSFNPKHEDKIAVCGYVVSLICDVPKSKKDKK